MTQLQNIAISLHYFVGVARPQQHQTRNSAQRGQMLDRLVRWTVLSISHGVVAKYEESRQLHQGGKPDGWTGIVAENKKRRAKRTQLRNRHSINNCCHRVL